MSHSGTGPVVSFDNVSKHYGSLKAVDGLSLDLQTIRQVRSGQKVIDPDLAAAALTAGACPLTPRERDVLAASHDGATIAEIAATLCLSEGTVRNYLSACIQKTGARNRTEALRLAEERGWL